MSVEVFGACPRSHFSRLILEIIYSYEGGVRYERAPRCKGPKPQIFSCQCIESGASSSACC